MYTEVFNFIRFIIENKKILTGQLVSIGVFVVPKAQKVCISFIYVTTLSLTLVRLY